MISLELVSLKEGSFSSPLSWELRIQEYKEQVHAFFEQTIGIDHMTAAHHVVLVSLSELIKNALDADAKTLFIDDQSTDKASISVFDDGSGFSSEFLGHDATHLDYAVKLAGQCAIISDKKGQSKLGGHGRGLAQAYEVIKNYEGSMICSNRCDGNHGANIRFNSSITPVLAADINQSLNTSRQIFSGRYCRFDSAEEAEKVVGSILNNFRFFSTARRTNKSTAPLMSSEQDTTLNPPSLT
ncbi:Histidine kinase-, DNA gyrase B-, and HSP90-like ATPase [Legionella sainthelensi]|uniref:ATP-binding protein n=1 Tax=Legionella sainthelensi TaxID=28087 RepID=UPI000E207E55|nr:ATP-binding protein [Legionella sainthelensi]VEB39573.1 Histidine kinase-, DNA gyrase B-, and HSP90-like ATPase [Legionella sainthelensi]